MLPVTLPCSVDTHDRHQTRVSRSNALFRSARRCRLQPAARQWCNPARRPVSHSVGQTLQFETCCTFYRSLSQKSFPKNKAGGKGKPEKAGQCWKSIDIQSLVSMCRTHEVNPYTWLVDVMQRIDPSRPRCGAADAATVEGELYRQPVDVRHRKGRPGTRAQIRGRNFTNQHPRWATSQIARLPCESVARRSYSPGSRSSPCGHRGRWSWPRSGSIPAGSSPAASRPRPPSRVRD